MKLFLTLACALISLFPACSQAEEKITTDKLELSVGMSRNSQSLLHGVLVTYRGAPTLNVSYETAEGFASLQNGVGVWLAHEELFKAGLSVNYMMGRQEKSDSRYVGMGDVAGSAMSYAWVEWQPVKDAITIYGNVGNSWHSASGTLAQWGATLGFPVAPSVNGFVDVSRYWANQRYVDRYYGVSMSQSQTSGYSTFNARSSGTLYANTQIGLLFELDHDTDLIAAYGRSTASALLMESPVLNQKTQAMSALVLNRRFH